MTPVVHSLLDTDLYKITMWQPFLHFFPGNQALYRFVCRNRPDYPLAKLRDDVEAQIEHLCTLRFTEEELAYLSSKPYLKSDFIDYLRIFQ
jgi:nicotinate phosphoribosyltransferase